MKKWQKFSSMKTIGRMVILIMLVTSCSKDEGTPPPTNTEGNGNNSPTLAGISPESGPKGTVVTITGTNFGTNAAAVKVFFNETEAAIQSVDENQITAEVPARAYTGPVRVNVGSDQLTGDTFNYIISEVVVSTIAGSINGYVDGPASAAQFRSPVNAVKDASGSIFVADQNNHLIRKISSDGTVSTIAGSVQGFADGIGLSASFNQPTGIALDGQGNLYVADQQNHRIRKITPQGLVSTIAGNTMGFADGQGATALFSSPAGVAVDASGNIFVGDTGNLRIRKITPGGEVSTFAGGMLGFLDGTGEEALFGGPVGLNFDESGNLFVADLGNNAIRKITPQAVVSTLAGGSQGTTDGMGTSAKFDSPIDVAVDVFGNVYVADFGNHRIRRITPEGLVSTLAGSIPGFVDGDGAAAFFNGPTGVIVGDQLDVLISDYNNDRIRKITQE